MKKLFFSFLIVLFSTLNFLSQTTASTLSVIAAPNSQVGWIYFKDPNTVDPNTLFTVYASNFGLSTDDVMQFVKNETDELGVTHTYYEHYYKNTKIDVGHNTVHSRNGKAHLVNGHICTGLNMSVIPLISSSNAITSAKNYVNATTYLWEDSIAEQNLRIQKNDVTATYYPSPELLITMIGADLPFIPTNFKLAYKVDIQSKMPYNHQAIYVDANSGNIIKEASLIHGGSPLVVSPNSCAPTLANTMYSGPQVIPALYTQNPLNGNAFEYKLENPCKGGGIITQKFYGFTVDDIFTNNSLTWGGGSTIEHLAQLHWSTDKFYDFLLSTFNRQSIDNNNVKLSCLAQGGSAAEYKQGFNLICSPVGWSMNDMTGHEWGHGITDYATAGGLPTLGEAVCISEGISDVWGTMFEFYLEGANADWLVGEDYSANAYVRDMSNPLSKNHADTYKGTNYDLNNNNTYENSGVLSYWFYLLSQGTLGQLLTNSSPEPNTPNTPHDYNIVGIGMSQPTQILYRAYPYLTSSSNYHDLRNATMQATRDLYGNNCPLLKTVSDTWNAVGVYDLLFDPNNNPIPNYCLKACVTKTDISCSSGLNSGTASIIIEDNGTGPYVCEWVTSSQSYLSSGLSINGLAPGSYYAQVYNNDVSCIVQFPFTVNDYSNTTLAFSNTNATCTDGSASVVASGGAYPYTYYWDLTSLGLPNATTAHLENLPASTYNVTVSDANGCQASGSTTIAQNPITFYKPFDYHVTATETWNQSLIKIDGVIYVDNGGILNITGNTRVEVSHHSDFLDPMPYGVARIIVLPGGTLNVAPTVTLTGCGGGIWDGIELWGTGVFNNGSALGNIQGQIENADIGIFTSGRPKKNESLRNVYGGRLVVNGAEFINNKVSIYMPKSSSPFSPAQQIKLSTFKINGTSFYKDNFSLANNIEPIHVFAGDNVYVNVSSNVMTGGDQYYEADLKGTGIKCIDCNLTVDNASGPISNFIGFTKAIDKENIFSTNNMVVNAANFTNNQEAIYLQASAYDEILNSTFEVPIPVFPFTKSYAVFSVNSSAFKIADNNINNIGTTYVANTYGIAIENSAATGGEVFKNTFTGLGIGLQAQLDNSNLKIGCNNFNNPVAYSMAIVNVSGFPASTLKWQGVFNAGVASCNNSSFPAGNEWNYSGCTSGSDKNIFTSNVNFNYETHSNLNTKPICTQNAWYFSNVLPYQCGIAKDGNSCNSIFPLPPVPPTTSYSNYYTAIKNLILNYQNQIHNLTIQYKNALETQDGGNTKNLLDAINLNTKKSAGQLKNLLNNSGALSDLVLLAVINRDPSLPTGTLKDILANQIPLSFDVLMALENLNLPTGIKNTIYAAQSNAPLYAKADALLGTIKNIQGDIILLQNELQRTKLKETNSISNEELKTSIDVNSKMILAQNYATVNQTDSVRLVLNQIATDTNIVLTEKQSFISYMNTMADMLDSNQTVYTVDSLLMSSIAYIGTSNTKVSAHANAALKERKKPYHQYVIADIPANNNQRLALLENVEQKEHAQLSNTGNFILFPNPNDGNFKLKLNNLDDYENSITIGICNLLGQVLYTKANVTESLIDMKPENLVRGVYIVTLTQGGKVIGQSKLIIE